jgi:hypothetical protein
VWYDGEFDKLQFVSKSLRYCQPLLGLIRRLLVLEPKDRLAGDEVPMLPAFVVIYFLFLLSFCCLQVYKHPWVQDQPPETPLLAQVSLRLYTQERRQPRLKALTNSAASEGILKSPKNADTIVKDDPGASSAGVAPLSNSTN